MQPYQEEYIANVRKVLALASQKRPEHLSFAAYRADLQRDAEMVEQKTLRNMALLRGELFPLLEKLFEAKAEELNELREFAAQLLRGPEELDAGLFCQIRQALLSRARLERDRSGMIRELYWLGMGHYSQCNKMVGLELEHTGRYYTQMRLCFAEAAAYLKYFAALEDTETKGYVLRAQANLSLGAFRSHGEKVRFVRKTLQILQDKDYRKNAPDLPWDRFLYMTHRQMAASLGHSRERVMTVEDLMAIMESAYIVYDRQLRAAKASGERPPVHSAYSYYVIEYYCGLDNLDGLLEKMEGIMDAADPSDFSEEGMYALISLPAFYCQFLQMHPEYLPEKQAYVESLYRKILAYIEGLPEENPAVFLYLRQLAHTYLETEGSLPYGEFLHRLMLRFAPELYAHSCAVGKAAEFLCGMILDEEPSFFDDIAHIRAVKDPAEKRRTLLHYAAACGAFHDVGKISFLSFYTRTARQWFEEEYEMAQLHTVAGEAQLAVRTSTRHCAAVALGHHRWYDGSRGFPESFQRLACPYRQMVDVIGLVDWLEDATGPARLYTGIARTYDEAVGEAIALAGRRFSPLLTSRLQDKRVAEAVRCALLEGREEAYRQMYEASSGERKIPSENEKF